MKKLTALLHKEYFLWFVARVGWGEERTPTQHKPGRTDVSDTHVGVRSSPQPTRWQSTGQCNQPVPGGLREKSENTAHHPARSDGGGKSTRHSPGRK